jgi:hypothetical protein
MAEWLFPVTDIKGVIALKEYTSFFKRQTAGIKSQGAN